MDVYGSKKPQFEAFKSQQFHISKLRNLPNSKNSSCKLMNLPNS